jgi:hypothetical protein
MHNGPSARERRPLHWLRKERNVETARGWSARDSAACCVPRHDRLDPA